MNKIHEIVNTEIMNKNHEIVNTEIMNKIHEIVNVEIMNKTMKSLILIYELKLLNRE